MTDANGVLAKLHKVRPMKPGCWMACCPAHEDRSPSLSIRDTGDRLLIHCFAGCDPERILAAIELSWTDLYPDEWQAAYAKATATPPKLKPVDPLALECLILQVAADDLEAGKVLSVEDRARVELALARLEATP